ncbi:hypothetical protein BKA62DRAFT_699341 [Auriculariales sp. MPI-PUGE-AT-0066]|nr:hypothetical protein BKA62DRAFT_699341 [Auriculariales sp. MPI-PUGE-AT-0066]
MVTPAYEKRMDPWPKPDHVQSSHARSPNLHMESQPSARTSEPAKNAFSLSSHTGADHTVVMERTAQTSISRLPVELLEYIFLSLPTKCRPMLSVVCRGWRDVLLSSPGVWSNVEYHPDEFTDPGALERMLARSGHGPLDLDVTIDPQLWKLTCSCILAQIARCVRLRVVVERTVPLEAATAVTHTLCTPAPLLRSFVLIDEGELFNVDRDPDICLFADTAPMLRQVKIEAAIDSLQWSSNALHQVQSALLYQPSDFRWEHITTLLLLLPSVEDLEVQLDDWDEDDAEECFSNAQKPLPVPDSLKMFTVVANENALHAGWIIRQMQHAKISIVIARYGPQATKKDDGTVLADICAIRPSSAGHSAADMQLSFIARTLSFEFATVTHGWPLNFHLFDKPLELHRIVQQGAPSLFTRLPKLTTCGAHVRAVQDVGRTVIVEPTIFAQVAWLYITETAVTTVTSALPSLPSLVHITIYTMKARLYASATGCSAFILASRAPTPAPEAAFPIICPALRSVRIAVRSLGGAQTSPMRTLLTPDMVTAYLTTYLRYGAPARLLDELAFWGVGMLVPVPMDLHEMLLLAKDVSWDPRQLALKFHSVNHYANFK